MITVDGSSITYKKTQQLGARHNYKSFVNEKSYFKVNAAKEKLSCNYDGEDMEIGFNAKYLLEMLNNVDTENVLIEMSQPNRAGILYPYEEKAESTAESILMLVMPVMLAN